MLFHIQNAIKDVDPEFIIRLHQALCKPITSDIVIHKLSDTCLNHAAPAVILAARTPKLMERLIDYVYISSPPSKTNMNFTRRRALNLMSCLFSTTAEGVAEDVETYSECYESLFLLYYWMTLPFKELLEKIEPDSICILKAHIFIKFVHHRVNSSDYYESYVDFNSTGSLHTILKRLAHRFVLLRPYILRCLFGCLKAPSSAVRCSTIGQTLINGILDHIVDFICLSEEKLVIQLFKENVSYTDDNDLSYAIKKIFCSIEPPFSISFVAWMCDWLCQIADNLQHMVLQSGIIDRFLDVIQDPRYLRPTPKHPIINARLQSQILRLQMIVNDRLSIVHSSI
ncbi:hypothetical protein DSO57_1013276 [Entomophthora muscae]|nr:hypothetical protein DSO57_1013276 [Entomophthora muscae]